ncbi:MAG: helix-turn-helix transcriptional regulator [Clostridiales bacterium]|nr:helix-turn-helix transcriptional regulator [Clostridiales bacterium]
MELKEKLKQARSERKISQQALADAIFVSRSAVAKWESGLGVPCNESMEALEKYFGVESGYFMTDKPDEVIVKKNIRMRKTAMICTALASVLIAVLITCVFVYNYYAPTPSDVSNKSYVYVDDDSGDNVLMNARWLYIHEDGRWQYTPFIATSVFYLGEWKIDGYYLILQTDKNAFGRQTKYVLKIVGDKLIVDEAKSDGLMERTEDGMIFVFDEELSN